MSTPEAKVDRNMMVVGREELDGVAGSWAVRRWFGDGVLAV